MAGDLETCAAAFFRAVGKDVATEEEFVMAVSLELKWMAPSDAKLLLSAMASAGFVERRDGYVRPRGDPGSMDVPLAYRPPKELVESLHKKTQEPVKQDSDEAPADVFPMLMSKAVESGMDRRDFIQSCNRIQKRLDIEIGVAALIVLRDAGADVAPYLDVVYDSIRAG